MAKPLLDVSVENQKFGRRITKLLELFPRRGREIVEDAAEMFVRSAVKETPPDSAATKAMRAKAGETVIQRGSSIRRPVIEMKRVWQGWEKTTTQTRFRVPYRRYGAPDDRGKRFFSRRSEASTFAKIAYRGAGKAGWWGTLLKMGKALGSRIKTTPAVQGIVGKLNDSTIKLLSRNRPSIVIVNKAKAVHDERKNRAAAWGYRKAAARLSFWAKKIREEASK